MIGNLKLSRLSQLSKFHQCHVRGKGPVGKLSEENLLTTGSADILGVKKIA